MFKQLISFKKKKAIFVCQINEAGIKVIKCSLTGLGRREFAGIEYEDFPAALDDKMLSDKTTRIFKRLDYNSEPVAICVSRNKATCRYIKIPSTQAQEIERIAHLQAPRYIPYQQNELITGYQIIASSREGYSHINLSIVHKDIIERFIKATQGLKASRVIVALSSYGLSNLFAQLYPHEQSIVILVDLDEQQAELVIVGSRKSLFSRSFRYNKEDPAWKDHFWNEIKMTRDAYLKEVSQAVPQKIVIFGQSGSARELYQHLLKEANLAVEIAAYPEKLKFSPGARNKLSASAHSFAACLGLALEELPESLNMLPLNLKDVSKNLLHKKEALRLCALVAVIILIFFLGMSKSLSNKALYFKKLKQELSKINAEARPLEEMDKRLRIIDSRLSKKPSTMDIVSGLFRVLPADIQLVSLSFDDDGEIILRGQAQGLDSVFNLIPELEKSDALAKFSIKVRYATKKNTERGETVDFEVVCQKK
ncbi:MAG: pilus assembly protein PilM [Candidatus Omnitrophica bacterium]|nr:pilus assembly protein PilM [Candidatus Omnitrophota bacterium]